MKKIDLNFFPGWTRKAITFTMDDGWVAMDTKFIDIIRPYGIKGTFNITCQNVTKYNDPQFIRATYRGYEIANHVSRHPFAFSDGYEAKLTDIPFDGDNQDKSLCYLDVGGPEGVYMRYNAPKERWDRVCTAKGYIALVEHCRSELEAIFGEGSVRGFAWPFYRQDNAEIAEYLKSRYYGLRDAGNKESLEDKSFSLPSDRTNWRYNATHASLLDRAAEYEALSDDGALKWLAFGVHTFNFNDDDNWNELEEFCRKYGNRPADFWYASNVEIFDYEDAVKSVIVTENDVTNPSDIDLCITVDGERLTLCAGCKITF